jgi:predicted aspartyl protease
MRRLPFPGGSTSASEMSHFWVSIQVGPLGGKRSEPLLALVDTGSTYTWVAADLLEDLGVEAQQERPFLLADGRMVRYHMGWVQIRLEGVEQPTIVVFAPTGSEPILGVVTLEEFGLAADPVNERLISVPGLAKRAS